MDVLTIDEACEGVDTFKTDVHLTTLLCMFTLHLSGTPLLANEKRVDAIFSTGPADEQKAKKD